GFCDVFDDVVNGFLCRPKDAVSLADNMVRIITMGRAELESMGLCGREKVERDFDEKIVIEKYLSAIEGIYFNSSRHASSL
ncbi:MAG: glycosyltransferase family 1 protein, partial [Verrucomicrobiota bacterium]|nr:glycosyltransferase family 1 protein [Verrucomicrobiota bacterium]